MDIFNYATKKITDILSEFGSDPDCGLNEKEAVERLEKFGYNRLQLKETTGWHIFFRQFKSAFIYLLLGALVITIALGENVAETIWLGNLASSFELGQKIEPFDIALENGLNAEQKKEN